MSEKKEEENFQSYLRDYSNLLEIIDALMESNTVISVESERDNGNPRRYEICSLGMLNGKYVYIVENVEGKPHYEFKDGDKITIKYKKN